MEPRTRSVQKSLAFRLAAMAVLLSLVAGSVAFFLERRNVEAAIAERTLLGAELLRARVRDIAQSSREPWENVVQKSLEELKEILPRSSIGRFVWVRISDTEGRELASLADRDYPEIDALIETVKTSELRVSDHGPTITPLGKGMVRSGFAVSLPIADRTGKTVAVSNGIFVISSQTVARYWQRIAWSVGAAIVIVILVTALHYPVISRLLNRLSQLTIHLLDANLETLQTLGSAIAKRDSDTDAHNFRVTIYAVRLAEAMALNPSSIRTLIKGAFLHDVGKIGVRDHILLKPGRLEEDEFEVMKTHVTHGLDIVNRSQWLRDAGDVVGRHHEKFDGTGYYRGLKGNEIPVTARIFAIVDVFDALTSERPYKKALGYEETMDILQHGAGSHFDPELLDLFGRIALPLYQAFGTREKDARSELGRILQHYFKGDIGTMLKDSLV